MKQLAYTLEIILVTVNPLHLLFLVSPLRSVRVPIVAFQNSIFVYTIEDLSYTSIIEKFQLLLEATECLDLDSKPYKCYGQ